MKKILFFGVLLMGLQSIAQKSTLSESYNNYFENTREIPFLHLNKTSFFKGEEIWFKAYLLEQNSQKLHKTSSNLYISLYDKEGVLQQQQLVALKNGMGSGSIAVDSTLQKATYFIKASTNWMRNFEEDHSYLQEINIINNMQAQKTATKLGQKQFYEFKIFPEGGHLLANNFNNIGILVKDQNNKGLKIAKGLIKDEKGLVIKEFSTNNFGLGNAVLFMRSGKKYLFEVQLESGIVLTQENPIIQERGIGIRVVNSNSNRLTVTVKTNKNSLPLLKGKSYTLLIHNTRQFQQQEFTFNGKDLQYALLVEKEKMHPGIHIVTVFNEKNTPVMERLVYVHKESQKSKTLELSLNQHPKDSLALQIQNPLNERLFLSASILPKGHKGNRPKQDIFSSFVLSPYVKGAIQNSEYYFKNTNPKKLRDLDLLLLTQGWSKYNWDHIFNSPPSTVFTFENGIDITGKFNQQLPNNSKVLVFSDDGSLLRELPVTDNQIKFPKSFITKNAKMTFALKKKQGYKAVTPILQFSDCFLTESQVKIPEESATVTLNYKLNNLEKVFKKHEVLDEVTISKKRTTNNDPGYHNGGGMLKYQKVDRLVIGPGETVLEFILFKGFKRHSNDGLLQLKPRGMMHNRMSLTPKNPKNANPETTSPDIATDGQDGLFTPVRVFLDDVEISHDIRIIESMYLDEADEIFFGPVLDMRSRAHVYIYSKTPEQLAKKRNYRDRSVVAKSGFAKVKQYYSPEFKSYLSNEFQHFGAVHWEPEVHLSKNQKISYSFDPKLQEHFEIHLQGISESGILISKKVVLTLP